MAMGLILVGPCMWWCDKLTCEAAKVVLKRQQPIEGSPTDLGIYKAYSKMDLEIKGTIFGQKQFVAWEGSSNWIASAADCSRCSLHQIFDGTLLISPSNWPPPLAHTMSCLQPVPSFCLSATCCFGIYQSIVPGFWCRAVPFAHKRIQMMVVGGFPVLENLSCWCPHSLLVPTVKLGKPSK